MATAEEGFVDPTRGLKKTLLWKAKMPEKMKEDDRENEKDERLTIGMNVLKGLPPNKD